MPRRALASVVLALLVLSAGCLGFGGEPDRTDRAEATLEGVEAAIQDVTTYHAETELDATAVGPEGALSREATIVGVVNATQKRSKMTMRMAGQNRTAYIDNRTAYQECESPWGWANSSIESEEPWIQTTPLGRHVTLLETGDLRVQTTPALTAEGAVALVGTPSTAALEAYRDDNTQPAIGGTRLENVTVRLVVDNRTHRPLRGSMSFEAAGDGATATVTMATTFSEYDSPIRVSIPASVTEDEFDWTGGCPGS